MAKILLIIAQEGFQTKEYHDTKRVLENAGHVVITGGVEAGIAISNIGKEAVVDIPLTEVSAGDYDALFIIGGPGALQYLDNAETIRIMKDAAISERKFYGAICISPRILAKAGILVGKHATGWDDDGELAEIFKANGVLYERKPVVIDGNVITADSPMSAEAFGHAIADALSAA